MSFRVTVLMTLYNKGPYVEEAVRSVLAQTFTDFELLVVDDASTDDGLARVRGMDDPRIRVIANPVNTGTAAAHNLGHASARGEYIAVLGADDLMLSTRIEKQVKYLDDHPEVGVCGSWLGRFGQRTDALQFPEDDASIRGRLLFSAELSQGASMMRRSVLERSGVRCPEHWKRPGMDYFFLANLAQHTRMANLPEVLTLYRIGPQNMRHGRDDVADRIARAQGALELFGLPSSNEEARLMVMLQGHFIAPPTVVDIWRMRRFRDALVRINRERGLFPQARFEARLYWYWNMLLDRSMQCSPGVAWAHLVLSRGLWTRHNWDRVLLGPVKRLLRHGRK